MIIQDLINKYENELPELRGQADRKEKWGHTKDADILTGRILQLEDTVIHLKEL